MPPNLEEVVRPGQLPATSTTDAHLTDWPVCTPLDTQVRRIVVTPDGAQVLFPLVEDAALLPPSAYQNPTDDLLSRILDLRGVGGSIIYQGQNSPRFAGLCHDSQGALYLADVSALQNPPGSPALQGIPFEFRPSEIVAIVNGLPADGGVTLIPPLQRHQYGVDPMNPHSMSLTPDTALATRIMEAIRSPNSPIDADRREAMASAFHNALSSQFSAQEGITGMRREMRYSMLGLGLLTLYTTLLATGKAGTINKVVGYPIRGVYNLLRAPFDRGAGLFRWWNDVTGEFRYRGLSTILGSGTNLTELARRGEIRPAADQGTATMIERIMNRISTPRRAGSAIVEAPPGWGKEVLMRNLALRNPNIIFIQTQPDDLMSGTMYRGQLEQKLRDIPREIEQVLQRGQRVVLCIDEFHDAITAGKSMEETRSLLERWKGPLANGTLRIVGFSTNDEMLKVRYQAGLYETPASRASLTDRQRQLIEQWEREPGRFNIRMSENIRPLLNRFRGFDAPQRTQEDMRAMLTDELERMRTQDHVDVRIEPRTIELIVRLSESPVAGEGYIPRQAFDLFDGVIASAAEHTDMDRPIEITHDSFERYVRDSWPRVAERHGLSHASAAVPPVAAVTTPVTAPGGNGAGTPSVVRTGWEDVLRTNPQVNDTAIYDGLRAVDQGLADYYRMNISTSAEPVTRMSDLIVRISSLNPDALTQVLSIATREGRPVSQMLDHAVFELVAQSAEHNRAWTDGDPTRRETNVRTFETTVRDRGGLERIDPRDPRGPEETDPTRRGRRRSRSAVDPARIGRP